MDRVQVDYPTKATAVNGGNKDPLSSGDNRLTDGERKKPREPTGSLPPTRRQNGNQSAVTAKAPPKKNVQPEQPAAKPDQPASIIERRNAKKIPPLDPKTILGIGLSLETAKIKDGPQLFKKPKVRPKSSSLEDVGVSEDGPTELPVVVAPREPKVRPKSGSLDDVSEEGSTERPIVVAPRVRRTSDVIDSLGTSLPNSPRNPSFSQPDGGVPKSVMALLPDWLEKSQAPSESQSKISDRMDSVPVNASETDATPMSDDDDENKAVYATMPVEMYSDEYNMGHPRRGHAVVFNHDTFDHGYEPRPGSDIDAKALTTTFEALGFQVTVHYNLSSTQIKRVVKQLKDEDHSDADCLVMVVLSHGIQGGYVLSKDDPFHVDFLWQSFKADVCPTLAGKPKMFFIQACRGEKLDRGVTMMKSPSRTQVDSAPSGYKIPSYADFLIAYSTVDGHFAWRNPEEGTWFIQCLCQELSLSGTTMDVLKLMTRVARRVALDHKSFNDVMPWNSEMKQVPMITSMLIRDIFFRPKALEKPQTKAEGDGDATNEVAMDGLET